MIYAKIDIEYFENYKWIKASRLALSKYNKDIKPYLFANIYLQYIFVSKEYRKPIDVRTNGKIDLFIFDYIGCPEIQQNINIINDIFKEIKLLNHKYCIPHDRYYYFNSQDVCEKNANKIAKSQTEKQTQRKQSQTRRQTKEYMRLHRLKQYQKKRVLSSEEVEEMATLQTTISQQKAQPQTSQTEIANTQTIANIGSQHPPRVRAKENKEREEIEENIVVNAQKENCNELLQDSVTEKSSVSEILTQDEQLFESFWKTYQDKLGSKKEAKKVFLRIFKATKDKDMLFAEIMTGLKRYLSYLSVESWQQKKHASAWLNQEKWQSEYPTKQLNSNNHANQNNTNERTINLLQSSGYSIKHDGSIIHFAEDDNAFYARQEQLAKIREEKQRAREQEQNQRKLANG